MRNSLSRCFVVSQEQFRHLDGELLFRSYTKLMASPGISGRFHFSSLLNEQPFS